jgi:hypothetical protein
MVACVAAMVSFPREMPARAGRDVRYLRPNARGLLLTCLLSLAGCGRGGRAASAMMSPAGDGGGVGRGLDGAAITSDAGMAFDGPPLFAEAGPPMPKSYPTFTAGSRLRAIYLAPADGPRQFAGLYDGKRGMKCDFFLATDGRLRCLPTTGDVGQLRGDVYSDQGCSTPQPIGIAVQNCTVPHFALGQGESMCGTEVHPLGMERTGPIYMMGRGFGLACPNIYIQTRYYDAGPAIAPAEFVDAELVTDRTGARLGALYAVASDGTRVLTSLLDTALGTPCRITPGSGQASGTLWCAPELKTSDAGFVDPDCKIPAGRVAEQSPCSSPAGPPAALVQSLRGDGNVCEFGGARLFEIGAALAPSAVTYYLDQGVCRRAANPSTSTGLVRAGREVSLPTLRREAAAGPGRLQAVDHVDQQGVRTASKTEWMDQARQELCEFKTASDDQLRCLPLFPGDLYYADSACSRMVMPWTPLPCRAGPPTTVVSQEVLTCGTRHRFYQRGARLPAAPTRTLFMRTNGTCSSFEQSAPEAYEVGPEIPPTDFVAGALTME